MITETKHLRLTQEGYENHTGPIGRYEFVDGISTEAVPENERRRLASAYQMNEINEDGSEEPASIAARMTLNRSATIDPIPEAERQTEEERVAEGAAAKWLSVPAVSTMTMPEIQAVLEKKGGMALRDLGNTWNVKNRSFVVLMQMINDRMEEDREKRRQCFGAMAEDELLAIAKMRPDLIKDIMPELAAAEEDAAGQGDGTPVDAPTDATASATATAAATGDLSATLNSESTK